MKTESARRSSADVDKLEIKKRRRVRLRLRRPPPRTANAALQELFHCCTKLFKGPTAATIPSTGDVRKTCRVLDCMKPEDVGLSRDLPFFKPEGKIEGTPRVATATIYKCYNFELCIFFLPANAVIPLHNHPGMTVFSKLLVGTMHVKAYDWFLHSDDHRSTKLKTNLAKLKANKTFTAPCNTSVLYPTSGGNIHEFRAVTPCVVLDVIGPPYSKDDGRDCSFYKELDFVSDKDELVTKEDELVTKEVKSGVRGCYRWLEGIEPPKESVMDGIEYLGPQIIDSLQLFF